MRGEYTPREWKKIGDYIAGEKAFEVPGGLGDPIKLFSCDLYSETGQRLLQDNVTSPGDVFFRDVEVLEALGREEPCGYDLLQDKAGRLYFCLYLRYKTTGKLVFSWYRQVFSED